MDSVANGRIALRIIDRKLVRIKTWPTDEGWKWETVIGAEPKPTTEGVCATQAEAVQAGIEAAEAKLH